MVSYLLPKDKKNRAIARFYELRKLNAMFFERSLFLSSDERKYSNFFFTKKLKHLLMFAVRSRNRCVISGRSGSVFRYFRLSRIKLKEFASSGLLTGVRKSSW